MSLNRQDATQKNESDGTARPALQGLQLHSSTGPVNVGTNAEWVLKATFYTPPTHSPIPRIQSLARRPSYARHKTAWLTRLSPHLWPEALPVPFQERLSPLWSG